MGRNARRRHGEVPSSSGWFLTDDHGTISIETLEEFQQAIAFLDGRSERPTSATEGAERRGQSGPTLRRQGTDTAGDIGDRRQ